MVAEMDFLEQVCIIFLDGLPTVNRTPAIFGAITGSRSRTALFWAYCFAGAVMVIAAVVEAILGVKAER
jgi:hypothetical protein